MKITKSFRKTLSVKIDSSGKVIVKAPKFASKKSIESFLEKHKTWIEKQQEKILKNKKEFKIGEKFYFFGEKIPLLSSSVQNPSILQISPLKRETGKSFPLAREMSRNEVKGFFCSLLKIEIPKRQGELVYSNGKFLTHLQNPEEIKQAFIQFYKREAKKYIVPRTYEIAEKLGLRFNKIRITSAKTRWGSCSTQKNVNFSWKLILTNKEAIDYVIIHELAHLTEMNHSKNFWDLVEIYSEKLGNGDWKKQREYLKNFTEANNF